MIYTLMNAIRYCSPLLLLVITMPMAKLEATDEVGWN